jgi:hypothetical protein
MVEYSCNNCNKTFNHKGTYLRHLNNKKPCKKTHKNAETVILTHKNAEKVLKNIILTNKQPEQTLNNNNNDNICDDCGKIFARRYDLKRHMESFCKTKKQKEIEDIKQMMINMQKELNDIKTNKKDEDIRVSSINNTNNINTQNIVNNTTNNILQNNILQNIVQINPFGKEQVDITDKQLIKFLRKCCNSVHELINFHYVVHFNKDMPENSNVYIPNVKATHAKIFTGDKWEIRDANDIVHQLYEDNNDYLMEQFEDKKEELDELTVRKFNTYVTRVEEPKTVKHVKKSIKQNLYNNRHIPAKKSLK